MHGSTGGCWKRSDLAVWPVVYEHHLVDLRNPRHHWDHRHRASARPYARPLADDAVVVEPVDMTDPVVRTASWT